MSDYIYELSGYKAIDFVINAKRTFASVIMPEDNSFVEEVIAESLKNKASNEFKY